jgi:hypothetical protein
MLCRVVTAGAEIKNHSRTRNNWTVELLETYHEAGSINEINAVMDRMLTWLPSQLKYIS